MAATILVSLCLLLLASGAHSAAMLTIANNCPFTVWPALLSGKGPLSTTGFALSQGESRDLAGPVGWSGRVWGRTACQADPASGAFRCATGDCGSGTVECSGRGAQPPATLLEFTLDGDGDLDFFDVSLVDGFNLPVEVVPHSAPGSEGRGKCVAAGCPANVNARCPVELRVTDASNAVIACRSACMAFNQPQYCCTGSYGNPQTCQPTTYSKLFKDACPQAYSYAYDDATSTFTCASGSTNYLITFCPSAGSPGAPGGGAPVHSSAASRISPAWF